MRSKVLGFIGLVLLAMPAAADDLDDASVAYEAERYDEAVILLTPLAEAGTVDAQLMLSNIYNFGFGVPVDQAKALHWLMMAAEQDDPGALYNAGVMTLQGAGTQPDPEEGLRLLQRAAELDSPDALYVLGVTCLQNAPQTGDVDTGLGYLARAGQLGQRGASAMLAVLLQDIPEVDQHLVKSAIHFQIAIARGCNDLGKHATRAIARLSSEERASYEYTLPAALEHAASELYQDKGSCLAE